MAEEFAYALVEGDSSGHDRFHLDRVRRMALLLAQRVGADVLVVEVAALLHDATDSKLMGDPGEAMSRLRQLLNAMPLEGDEADQILHIVAGQSFSASLAAHRAGENSGHGAVAPLAFQVVQDADRLDAIGAIGIARCFAYGGRKGQPMHHPDLKPRETFTLSQYREGKQSSLNHFYEKLFLLKDKLHTPAARAIAEKRHAVMADFVNEFLAEWEVSP